MFIVESKVYNSDLVTLDEAKNYLRVQHSNDDDLITKFITTAQDMLTEYLQRAIVSTTVIAVFEPELSLYLPYPNVYTIDTIDTDVEYTLNESTNSIKFDTVPDSDISIEFTSNPKVGNEAAYATFIYKIVGMLYGTESGTLSQISGINKYKYLTLW